MAMDLNKLFIQVESSNCETFRKKFVTPPNDTDRLTTYDDKICFLKDKSEIFTKGQLFGLNNLQEVEDLEKLVGVLPAKPATYYTLAEINEAKAIVEAEGYIEGSNIDAETIATKTESDIKEEAGEYESVIAYIQAVANGEAGSAGALTSNVIIAGGYLANNVTESKVDPNWPSAWIDANGAKFFPAGLTFEEFVQKMFLAEQYGVLSDPVYAWSPSQSKPTVTISRTGSVPVGTEVTLTVTANSTVNNKAASATVNGAEYGYSLDGTSKVEGSEKDKYYVATSKDGKVNGDNTCTQTWTGITGNKILATTVEEYNAAKSTELTEEEFNDLSDDAKVLIDNTGKYFVTLGTNTLTGTQTGLSITPGSFTETTVYSMNNTGTVKKTELKTINDEAFANSSVYASSKELGSTKTASVTGYYPVYCCENTVPSEGGLGWDEETAKSKITESLIKGVNNANSNEEIPELVDTHTGSTGFIIAIPNGKQTNMELINTKDDTVKLTPSRYFDLNITMLNNVATIPYRVLYIATASTSNNDATWYVSLK